MHFNCDAQIKNKVPKETKQFVKIYADSINNLKVGNPPPAFLSNPCFDYQKQYWIDRHKPLSLRKMVIDEVNNKSALNYILELNDSKLSEVCSKPRKDTIGLTYYVIPNIEKSFSEFIKSKLKKE